MSPDKSVKAAFRKFLLSMQLGRELSTPCGRIDSCWGAMRELVSIRIRNTSIWHRECMECQAIAFSDTIVLLPNSRRMLMLNQTQWTKGSRTGLLFFTGGVLLAVWVAVWYFTRSGEPPLSDNGRFWIIGLLLTGVTFVVIGIMQGAISRVAQKTEESLARKASEDLANAQASTAAARIPVVVPPTSAAAAPIGGTQIAPSVPVQVTTPSAR